jgi:tRNA modification GTPase
VQSGDTIAAISSAVGQAARMIVRLSGPDAVRIASGVLPEISWKPASAVRSEVRFRGLHVPATICFFKAPHSYTAEHVVEFHIPGNPLLARMLLDELIGRGGRRAEAGEFTARAYFNGRLDLSAAEGVAATIAAQSRRELRAARQLLSGELSRRLRPVLDMVADSLAVIEVGLDFSEEGVSFISSSELRERLMAADQALEKLLTESTRFEQLSHEPSLVLVGYPNAGKSTLLNALAGHERAVVADQPGTTRDAIWAHARLGRGMVRILDVAGLDAENTDEIATKMQEKALQAAESGDFVLLVLDLTDSRPPPALKVGFDLTVRTKLDLAPSAASVQPLAVSALTGQNMDLLRARLDELVFGQPAGGQTLALNARHVESVTQARQALSRAVELVGQAAPELIALELREALDCLGRVLGSVTPDDVLGRIFSTFCIGK